MSGQNDHFAQKWAKVVMWDSIRKRLSSIFQKNHFRGEKSLLRATSGKNKNVWKIRWWRHNHVIWPKLTKNIKIQLIQWNLYQKKQNQYAYAILKWDFDICMFIKEHFPGLVDLSAIYSMVLRWFSSLTWSSVTWKISSVKSSKSHNSRIWPADLDQGQPNQDELHRCWWRSLETKYVGDKLEMLVTDSGCWWPI